MKRTGFFASLAAVMYAAFLAVALSEPGLSQTLSARGQILAETLCASCHAIRHNGASPHSAAPAFRVLGNQMELGDLAQRLRRGLLTGHQDMPMFRFKRDDADALSSYIRSIQRE